MTIRGYRFILASHSRNGETMTLCRFFVLPFALFYSVTVAADSLATMLQFSRDFGAWSSTRISLRLNSADLDHPAARDMALPLYASRRSAAKWYPMRNAEDRRPFCERSPNGCLAFGILLGVGITYFVVEAINDADGDTRISFTSGSGGVTGNNTR